MDRSERFLKIRQMIKAKGFVSQTALLEALEVSTSTFKRDLEYMRSRLGWPITWNPVKRGYVIEAGDSEEEQTHELPGLWFNASEIYALLAMQHLLKEMQPGLLDQHIAPLQAKLRQLMGEGSHAAESIERRVKLIHLGARTVKLKHFEQVARALLDRQRLQIRYLKRDSQEVTDREISPLQLVHYRENWFLDAWCHMRNGIRTFSLDAMQAVQTLTTPARDVSPAAMTKHFESGYGIFAGQAKYRARLKFSSARAQWVSLETWHPAQSSRFLKDGSYLLEVPYSNDQELLMDLLRHGAEVEVLGPPELRRKIALALKRAAEKYSQPLFQ